MTKDALLRTLLAAAVEAGRAAYRIYESGFEVQNKADQSPVTAADHAAEAIILQHLARVAPSIPVVAEEQAAAGRIPTVAEEFFLVDPLDGTKEFIHRRGDFTVNIALIRAGVPVLGVVYAPVSGHLYVGDVDTRQAFRSTQQAASAHPVAQTAASDTVHSGTAASNVATSGTATSGTAGSSLAGSGTASSGTATSGPHAGGLPASGLGQRIQVRPVPAEGITVVISRSHSTPETEAYLTNYNVAERVSVGSSLKFCLVAEGKADLYPRLGPTMEWDTAAGHAVLTAAGGSVSAPGSVPLVYGKPGFRNSYFIATGPLSARPLPA